MQEINSSTNPFPGLRPFESTETHLFFGRDGQSEELLRRLKRTRFLAVVGTSGSGKSSLVRAGLLPALQGGLMASAGSDWRIAILRPGSDPIGNLARALASPMVLGAGDEKSADMQVVLAETTLRRSSLGLVELVSRARTKLAEGGQPLVHDYENLLIVVDQFEELFRFKQLIGEENSPEDAAAFVKLLLEAVRQAAGKIYVVLTMRSDFLGDCAQFWELPEAINNGQYLIPRMTRDERREAISGPAAVGQGAISEPLVNQLLNDVGDNPDQLPILQHALMRTWDYWLSNRRNGEPVDIPDYNAIGGMAEALSRHADEAYQELDDKQKVIAEKLFKGLTEKGTDNREIRRPMEVQEICELTGASEAAVITVVEVFRREGRSFLMPPPTDALTGAPVPLNSVSLIDISHESLIRNWSRLKTWTEEEAQSARIYKRLAETAMLHKAGEEALLKDPALQAALDWREKNKPHAVWARRYHPEFETAMSFLDASVAARDVEVRERQMQLRKEVSYKRTKLVAFLLAFSVLLSLGSAVYAFRQGARAEMARMVAVQQTAEALEQRKLADVQRQRADDEAREAGDARDDADKQRKLAMDEQKKAEDERARAEEQAALARENERLASAAKAVAEEQRVRADAEALKNRQLLYPADINLAQQAYEAGNLDLSRELLNAHPPATKDSPTFEWYYLWRLLNPRVRTFEGPADGVLSVSPDGKILAVGTGGAFELRDLESGKSETVRVGIRRGFVAYSPDGKVLAVIDSGERNQEGEVIKFLDIASRKEVGSLAIRNLRIVSAAFTPDGKRLVTGGFDDYLRLWDVASQREVDKFEIGAGASPLAVSPDGKTVATTSGDSYSAMLWDLASHKQVGEFKNKRAILRAVAFSPDGSLLATINGGTASLWDVALRRELTSFDAPSNDIFSLAFSPDGKRLALGNDAGVVEIHDVVTKRRLATVKGHGGSVRSLTFSLDGKLLVSSGDDSTVKSWDVSTQINEQPPLPIREGAADALGQGSSVAAFSGDGQTFALGVAGGTVRLWDVRTRRAHDVLTGNKSSVWAVGFSPDGRVLATGGDDATVRLWETTTYKQLGTPIKTAAAVFSVAFSPDGRSLAVGNDSRHVALWDISMRKKITTLPQVGSVSQVWAIQFSPNGRLLAIRRRSEVELWDNTRGTLITRIQFGGRLERPIVFSPDSRVLAISTENAGVTLYDTLSLNKLILKGHNDEVTSIAFSPDGKRLATASQDRTAKLWDLASNRTLLTLSGHSVGLNSVAFSSDGRTLVTGDYSRVIRLWHAATSEEVAGKEGPRGAIPSR